MIKKLTTVAIAGVIIVAIALPKIEPLFSSEATLTDSPGQQADQLRVEGFIAQHQKIENKIFTTGTILSNEEVELSSEISGKITKIYFREGQSVEEGELLIKINDSELKAELERVQYRLELAKTQERRQRQLLEKGGISQSEYDAAYNEMKVLQAEKKLIDAQIEKTEIRAPFSGRIGLKYVSEGSYISPNTRIASLQDINPVKIDFSIPERYSNSVDPGDKILFNVQGRNNEYQAEIYAVEPKINVDTRTLQIRAISSNERYELLPGAFADLELVLENIDNALLIPTIALIPEIDGNKVFIYQNGQVVERKVRTGIRQEQYIQILEGLSEGDTLLTTGLLQVKPGTRVALRNITNEVNLSLK